MDTKVIIVAGVAGSVATIATLGAIGYGAYRVTRRKVQEAAAAMNDMDFGASQDEERSW